MGTGAGLHWHREFHYPGSGADSPVAHMRFTIAQFDQAISMREWSVPWKIIERELGEGIQSAYGNYKFRLAHEDDILTTRKHKGLLRPKAVRSRSCRLVVHGERNDGLLVVTERRIRICANAYFGIPLTSGLDRTPTLRDKTVKTIGALRRKGLIYGDSLTQSGLDYLNLIMPKGQRR